MRRAAEMLSKQGNVVEVVEIDGDGGHLEFLNLGKIAAPLKAFLVK